MSELSFINENVDMPDFFSEELLKSWADVIADDYGYKCGRLSFLFCNDEKILEVNRKYLNHDFYTDVITFDYVRRNTLSGDIVISLDTVLSNSQKFKVTYETEFYRVFCHSILHLIGYKDKTPDDADEMRRQEDYCLGLLFSIM